MKKLLWCAALVALTSTFVMPLSCSDDDAGPTAPADVVYTYGATDEVWITFDEATPQVDDASAPRLVAPAAPVPRTGPAPTFTWEGGAIALATPRRVNGARRHASAALTLWDVLDPVSLARAHEPPVTGTMYRFIVTIAGDPQPDPVRVLSGQPMYAPAADLWERMATSTAPLSIEITGAYFTTGRITEGPFVASAPFTVGLE